MKLTIDTVAKTIECREDGSTRELPLYGREAFELLSDLWVRVGWNEKYTYTFSWMGRPIIQLPEDMVRMQEVVYQLRPDVIVETGIAHGGSLVFSASLCKAMGRGRVIGVDIEIRPHNRTAIERHELASFITLIEGSSADPQVAERVRSKIGRDERVLVILDSNHTKAHVLSELELYGPLVCPGSYIVATDGIMRSVADVPRGTASWVGDNPYEAAREFVARHPEFIIEGPTWPFNESQLSRPVTHYPDAWLKRVAGSGGEHDGGRERNRE